jgi:hypothetical protein
LDDDSATPDNGVLFSDLDAGKIQAIAGYQLVPAQHKNELHAEYDALPTRETRSIMGDDPEIKKDLKTYFRKFPTADQQARNPFTNFTREIFPFNVVKDVIDHIMGDFWGIKLFSVKKNPEEI